MVDDVCRSLNDGRLIEFQELETIAVSEPKEGMSRCSEYPLGHHPGKMESDHIIQDFNGHDICEFCGERVSKV